MPTYVTREVSKIWRRIVSEFTVEVPLLQQRWKFILFGLVFQYIHGVGARVAHYLHRPGPLLHDVGFDLLPELGAENSHISETLFTFIFVSYVLWTFHPFVFYNKRFYTAVLWHRTFAVLVVCQTLRVASFLVTQLPGPNYHCREGQAAATLHVQSIKDVLLLNFPYGVIYGCGDLIFSSHMIFALTFCHHYSKYGSKRWMKRVAWMAAVALSFLIVASRKHYTVDVVIAWYVVFLVFNYVDRCLSETDTIDRMPVTAGITLLPLNVRVGKESRNEKMLNGNSGDVPSDWRQRTPVNGKHLDDANSITMEVVVNGSR